MQRLLGSFIIYIACGVLGIVSAQAQHRIVPVERGPLGNSITSLLQDNDGFLWVGTISGVMRYDMYGYLCFDDADGLDISRTQIRCLTLDQEGRIWMGTENGAVLYDPASERFSRIGGSLAATSVKSIACTSQGSMLLTTIDGIAVVDSESLAFEWLAGTEEREYLKNIRATTTDSQGAIWCCNQGRLVRFDFSSRESLPEMDCWDFPYDVRALAIDEHNELWFNDQQNLMRVPLPDRADKSLSIPELIQSSIEVRSIRVAADQIAVTTLYNGIHFFRLDEQGRATTSEVLWISPNSVSDVCNSVICSERDHDGCWWFGTVDGLYAACERPDEAFHNLAFDSQGGLLHNVVSDLCIGPDRAIWATTTGGLDRIVRTNDGRCKVRHIITQRISNNLEQNDHRLQSLVFDRQGILWLGTKRQLLFYDTHRQRVVERADINDFLVRKGATFNKELYCDRQGNIWMGFIYGDLIVYRADSRACQIVRFQGINTFKAIPQSVLEDASGNIWVGTKTCGLLRFLPDDAESLHDTLQVGLFDTYFAQDRTLGGFISINALHATANGNIYAGTSQGLYRYNAQSDSFDECPLTASGEKVWVLDLQEDHDGRLWVSTSQGLYQYTEGEKQAPFYEIADGAFARLDYNIGSCIDTDGTLFIGGINGITYFQPCEIVRPKQSARVHISGVSIFNKRISPDGIHLQTDINRSRRLVLRHEDRHFALDFTTLKFSPKGQDRFYYKIDGTTLDWTLLEGNRLTFSNLARGEYRLQIKVADASGIVGHESTDLHIVVLPPWWATGWAYALYALMVILLTAGIIQIFLFRYRAAQQVRMVQYKQQLFINLTHGLKTPLTMMQVPLQLLSTPSRTQGNAARSELLAMVSTNVKKLANTIRQLMEFRKIDQNRLSMNLAEIDMVDYIGQICEYFRALFESKGLTFEVRLPSEHLRMTVDPEKIELAIYNILQNAYTFTRPGGLVRVDMQVESRQVSIRVEDTGVGIRKEHLGKIFQRFYQIHDADTIPPLGAGIGLSVAKEFVEMHHGSIAVESQLGSGSTFTLTLPLESRYKQEHDYVHRSEESDNEQILPLYTKQYAEIDLYHAEDATIDERKSGTVYVIAGSEDMMNLARWVLPEYHILHYNQVDKALQDIKERRPQLVLIDIVVYDREEGLSFCRRLKASKQTDDIPVLLLTADDTPEDARLFCEAGVDAWIEKPFDVELFRARVKQLVNRHTNLQQKIKIGQILGKSEDIVIESADEQFINRVMETIERNIANEEFSLEVFASEMRISRSALNMRIQNLVGKSPMELLRNARMQRAAQLLETNAYDVAQVGYLVGFSDPRYFSTSFKKQFGISPRAYMQNHANN